jgi:predicted MFS family arabinose efflux permease
MDPNMTPLETHSPDENRRATERSDVIQVSMNEGRHGGINRHKLHALAGAAATAAGNGLARFAYVPLFPAMVSAAWVSGSEAGTLGALTLSGAVIGTFTGRPLAGRLGVPATLNAGMLLAVLSLLACSWNGGFWWFAPWRLMAGVAGGFLMATAGPAAVSSVPHQHRGTVGGIVVAGVGIGIVLGALSVPLFLGYAGVAGAWAGLSGLVAILWIGAYRHWPAPAASAPVLSSSNIGWGLLNVYALHSAGMVPPMVYLADLAVRGHHYSLHVGALIWGAFGIFGVVGGLASGKWSSRFGNARILRMLLAVQVLSLVFCVLPLKSLIIPAAGLAGFAAVGISTVTLLLAREIAGEHAGLLWVRCTAGFAIVQAITGFAMAWMFAITGENHMAVFGVGAGLSLLACLFAKRL